MMLKKYNHTTFDECNSRMCFVLELSTGGTTADQNKFIFAFFWLLALMSPSFVGLTELLFGNYIRIFFSFPLHVTA
jgi:hypothetical protein